jgi:hypothetical protein
VYIKLKNLKLCILLDAPDQFKKWDVQNTTPSTVLTRTKSNRTRPKYLHTHWPISLEPNKKPCHRYWAHSYRGRGDDVPAGDRTATVGEGERDDGDRGAGCGAERAGGADRAVHEDAEGDPGGAAGRGLPEGRGELHHAEAQGVPGGAGLGGHREAPRLWPGRGAHRGGSRRAHSHRQNDRFAHFFFFFENLFLNLFLDVG